MKIKNLFPLTLLIWPYLIAPLFLDIFDAKTGSGYLIGYCILTVFVYLANILYACRCKAAAFLIRWNVAIKLAHIPFYFFLFCIGIAALAFSPLLMVVDLLLMLTSSAYGISTLLRAKKNGLISSGFAAANLLCHFLFVLDKLSAVVS